MTQLFNVLLYQPIFNLLVFLYNIVPGNDIGIAIILLTVIIKLLLYPLSIKSIRSQKALQEIQPKMEELKKKFTGQKDKLAQELMKLYRAEKVNPFSSCLPIIIQLPFLIAVFRIFRIELKEAHFGLLYPFINNPGILNPVSFGMFDLSQPNLYLAIITGAVQFWQTKMMITNKQPNVNGAKDEKMLSMMNKQMVYFMPLFTVFIGAQLPAGLVLYWFATTLLMVFQQYFVFKKDKNKKLEVKT